MKANIASLLSLGRLFFFVFFLINAYAIAGGQAKVSGIVRDASGNAVAHAHVEAIPVAAKSGNGTVGSFPSPWIAADSAGGFSLSLAPGRYRIRAKDEADGYPDPSFGVNIDPKVNFPEIAVGNKETTNVDVVLGRQGGILGGEVRDVQDHKPLAGAKIRIQDARNADAYVEIFSDRDGRFGYAVPNKPIRVSITAPGYKAVVVENGTTLTLSSGEHREVDIELEHQ